MLFTASFLVPAMANAANERTSYAGLTFHQIDYSEDNGLWDSLNRKEDSTSSWGVIFGSRRGKFLGTELAYHDLGSYDAGSSGEISAANFSYALTLSLPLDVVEPYLLGGFGFGMVSYDVGSWNDSGSGFSTRLGLGLRIPLGERFNLSLFTEKVRFDIELESSSWSSTTTTHEQEFSLTGLALEYRY
ncbi:outer membrane beta-barrel protein [Marinospirillum perlucidum]|uniref:outer membrane beta-barrel protein n=1 Tax=Marinospirillum perlucidum TaxID=1982602 RepID=UPI002482F1C3|nr:outer membrane beta-barrel protein [Marinospirillum perlucidum]